MICKIKDNSNNVNKLGEYTIENGCLLRGIRVVIPETLKEKILAELHLGHLGIVKMKGLARSYVHWTGIDKNIERTCKSCKICTNEQNQVVNVKPHPWEYPKGRIHMDFAGQIFVKNYIIIIGERISKRHVNQLRSCSPELLNENHENNDNASRHVEESFTESAVC